MRIGWRTMLLSDMVSSSLVAQDVIVLSRPGYLIQLCIRLPTRRC